MEEDDTQYETYEGSSDNANEIVLYSLIASVFSAAILLSLGAFVLSNRKCCSKRKTTNPEEALMKQRLLQQRKSLLSSKFQFPFRPQQPMMSPVLQQEENEIAREVKESYKNIPTNVAQHMFHLIQQNPTCGMEVQNIQETLSKNEDNRHLEMANSNKPCINVNSIGDVCDKIKSKSEACDKENNIQQHLTVTQHKIEETAPLEWDLDSLNEEGIHVSLSKDPAGTACPKGVSRTSNSRPGRELEVLRTPLERLVPTGEPVNKADLLQKWVNQDDDERDDDDNDEDDYDNITNSLYETSPSKGNDQLFPLEDDESILTSISRMDAARMKRLRASEFYQNLKTPVQDNHTVNEKEISSVLIQSPSMEVGDESWTHEELMQAVIGSNSLYTSSHDDDDEKDSPSEYTETNISREHSYFTGSSKTNSPDYTYTTLSSDNALNNTSSTRPKSLDLKRRNTELKIDISDSEDVTLPSQVYDISKSSCISSNSQTTLTSWKELSKRKKKKIRKTNSQQSTTSINTSSTMTSSNSSNTSSTTLNISKKFRTPKKYQSPRRLKKNNSQCGVEKHVDMVLPNERRGSTSVVNKRPLPKFVTRNNQSTRK